MQPIHEHRLKLGGAETRALELDGEGPPLLLLHGFADSADTWRLVLDRLRRAGRAAVALDMPGFGAASRLTREPELILPQLDTFVAAAVERWAGAHGVILAGNSLGGMMALRSAQRDELPVDAIAPISPPGLDLARWIAIIQREPLLRALLASPVPVPAATVQAVVSRVYRLLIFAKPRQADPRVVAGFAGHFTSKRDAIRIMGTARRLLPELEDPYELERISCPALIIWGERDRMVPAASARRFLARMPGAKLELLPGIGHCAQVEAPDRIAELLCELPVRAEAVTAS